MLSVSDHTLKNAANKQGLQTAQNVIRLLPVDTNRSIFISDFYSLFWQSNVQGIAVLT